MSKSKGNVVGPWEVIDRFGADALRWYFFTSKQPWDGYLFSPESIGEGVRLFLRQLWNTYTFSTLYEPDAARADAPQSDLDRWIGSRLSATIATVTERLDAYDATTAGRAVAAFVDDLSNWYVRRSRRRFWEGDGAAHDTLRHCLADGRAAAGAVRPVRRRRDLRQPRRRRAERAPDRLARARAERDLELETAMAIARETVRLGLAARGAAKLKVRQPLHEAVVVAAGRERDAIERLADVVREELNVKALRFVSETSELGSYTLKPNYRTLGPRFGKAMPQVAAAVAALDAGHVADALREGTRGRDLPRRPRPRARRRRPAARHVAAGGLPARARGLARGRAGAAPRRRAAPRGPRARGRARGPERPPRGRGSRSQTASC